MKLILFLQILTSFNGPQKWKSFFPDSWDEIKVVRGIKNAFINRIPDGPEPNVFKGTTSEGIWIQIILNADGTIKTAYPKI
jgi:hypothetical protein